MSGNSSGPEYVKEILQIIIQTIKPASQMLYSSENAIGARKLYSTRWGGDYRSFYNFPPATPSEAR